MNTQEKNKVKDRTKAGESGFKYARMRCVPPDPPNKSTLGAGQRAGKKIHGQCLLWLKFSLKKKKMNTKKKKNPQYLENKQQNQAEYEIVIIIILFQSPRHPAEPVSLPNPM